MMNRGLVLLLAAFVGTAQAEIPLAQRREGAGIAIVEPRGSGFTVVGTIRIEDWQALE